MIDENTFKQEQLADNLYMRDVYARINSNKQRLKKLENKQLIKEIVREVLQEEGII